MPDRRFRAFFRQIIHDVKTFPWQNLWRAPFRRLSRVITSWWQWLILMIIGFLCLYYPIGGSLVNKIDMTIDYEIKTTPEQSATLEMMAFLIKRETADHIWTPGLPFIFPSYFLDNMPNFQLGMMSSLRTVASSFARRLDKTVAPSHELPLKTAAELLNYPGTVWMFSPHSKLPVPSASTQYKKARKQLTAYNQLLRDGNETFYKSRADLAYFLKRITRDLWLSSEKLEAAVREDSSSWFDNKSDDLFYYQQGKLYAYYLLLKALSYDYKDTIVAADLYQPWTQLLKALEDASALSPSIIRNGEPASLTAPNHLIGLDCHTLKAAFIGQKIVGHLTETTQQGK